MASAPVGLPLPTALVNTANNILASISNQLGLWEMREFTMQEEGLMMSFLHDTPSMDHNNSPELKQLIGEYADDILNGNIQISEILAQGHSLQPTMLAPANPFDPWRLYAVGGSDRDIARDARLHSHFASKTCQGCHSTQTTTNGLFHVLNDLLLHARHSRELQTKASQLLRVHQREELQIANIDAFYLISPLRDPGPEGQNHLAPFLTRRGGHLDRLEKRLEEMAESCSAEPTTGL